MNIAIVYGSTTRYTEMVADNIARQPGFKNAAVMDIDDTSLSKLIEFDVIIFGIPTWDYGEMQTSWQEIWHKLVEADFTDKVCAFFGLGDQQGYSEWFLDAMGILHDLVASKGAIIIGEWPVDGYTFNSTIALTRDHKHFVGLAIDDVNQQELTDIRVKKWCRQLHELIA